jgi:hypothetical protein
MTDAADDLRQEVSRAMQDEGPLVEALKIQLERVWEFVFGGGHDIPRASAGDPR